jgi:hypothetical protein
MAEDVFRRAWTAPESAFPWIEISLNKCAQTSSGNLQVQALVVYRYINESGILLTVSGLKVKRPVAQVTGSFSLLFWLTAATYTSCGVL